MKEGSFRFNIINAQKWRITMGKCKYLEGKVSYLKLKGNDTPNN